MRTVITRADQNIARLDVELAERLGEPVDPRVKAIAEMDPSDLDETRPPDLDEVAEAAVDLFFPGGRTAVEIGDEAEPLEIPKDARRLLADHGESISSRSLKELLVAEVLKRQAARERRGT